MAYEDYKKARDCAWACLIKNNIVHFPLDIESLIKKQGISVIDFEKGAKVIQDLGIKVGEDAFSANVGGKRCIFFNQEVYHPRMRFSLAHELGHYLLEHITPETQGKPLPQFYEDEADFFASRLLMPAIVCKHENLDTVAKIQRFFDVSKPAAERRFERMKVLLERNYFCTSPLEKEYYRIYLRSK